MTSVVESPAHRTALGAGESHHGVVPGLAFAALAFLAYASSDAVVKLLAARYSVSEIMVFHASFALLVVVFAVARFGRR